MYGAVTGVIAKKNGAKGRVRKAQASIFAKNRNAILKRIQCLSLDAVQGFV
jgi:hypothetical protein